MNRLGRKAVAVYLALFVLLTAGTASAGLKVENGYAVITDTPKYRLKKIDWMYMPSPNPDIRFLVLTRNRVDRSAIMISLTEAGKPLRTGLTKTVRRGMSLDEIQELLMERLESETKFESLESDRITVSGLPVVRLRFLQPSTPVKKRWTQIGFLSVLRDGH